MVSQGLSQLEECPERQQIEGDSAEMIQDKDALLSEEPVDRPRNGDTAAAGADRGEKDELNEVKL